MRPAKKSVWQRMAALPFFKAVGNVLYALGFYAEAKVVLVWRVVRNICLFMAQLAVWLFRGLFRGAARIIKGVLADIAAPFKQVASGYRNMRKLARAEKRKGNKKVNRKLTGYLADGIKAHGHLVPKMLRFVMPVFALGVFVFTIQSVLGMRYALSVSVGDTEIGYVENETVLEDGLSLLRMRISLAQNQSVDEWEFTPTLAVSPTKATLNKTQVADKILESSSGDIQKGYGIYIDGNLVGATADGDALRQFLEDKKGQYYDPDLPEATIEFVREVEVPAQEEIFLGGTVKTVEELEEALSQNISETETYTTLQGDTLGEIARQHGITLEELLARNPGLEGQDEEHEFAAGTTVVIQRAEPYLQVKKVVRSVVEEAVPFETIRVEVDTRRKGQQATVQQGINGTALVSYDSVYIDGELVSKDRVDEQPISPVQNKIIEVGTLEVAGGYGSIGGGAGFIWPVPDAKYSSRGMTASHRGLDINAPTGTPIYAAAGGLVITSGWHNSYGNYIMIQHPDGLVSLYGHCSELLVPAGVSVAQGDAIALVGSTGYSTGPHCHFEIQQGGRPIDPAPYVIAPWA
ncbi:peptidoglycan DD-metalloendopeptidase family protein [Ruminococcaceae bacterium OttesenSCG-928-A16]|nr:peptidoglycan DD-metalloendopeptidase family protein [Ruminococcaceae bacterium OttesenSCG-928-A16]